MKKLILSAIAVLFTTGAMAQSNDYYLPKTGISFIFEVQRDVKDGNVDYSSPLITFQRLPTAYCSE